MMSIPTILLWFHLYSFSCRRSALVSVSLFSTDGRSENSCDCGVPVRRGELRVFSTLPFIHKWTLRFFPCLGYYEECSDKQGSAGISSGS